MVTVDGKQISSIPEAEGFAPGELQRNIFDIMLRSRENYRYDDIKHLLTELMVRKSIVDASRALARSGFSFAVFRDTKANPEFWNRNSDGGFELKAGALPSGAIQDIYNNGRLYSTECSTAMIIVLYKAMLDVLPKEQFNRLYSGILLMNWLHLDRDLGIVIYPKAADLLPGDARYFSNPDVDPTKPQWQGENVYYLGGGIYYGHGIGISDADGYIRALNRNRKSGATQSAYLNDMVKRQDYKQLAGYMRQSLAQEPSPSQPAAQGSTVTGQQRPSQPAAQGSTVTIQPRPSQPAAQGSPVTGQMRPSQPAAQGRTGTQESRPSQPAAQGRTGTA